MFLLHSAPHSLRTPHHPLSVAVKSGTMNGEELGTWRSPKWCYKHFSTFRLANVSPTQATSLSENAVASAALPVLTP